MQVQCHYCHLLASTGMIPIHNHYPVLWLQRIWMHPLEFEILSAFRFAFSYWGHLFGFGLMLSNMLLFFRKMWLINTELLNDEFYLNDKQRVTGQSIIPLLLSLPGEGCF